MALRYSAFLQSDVCVYDCMDELAAFKNAPDELASLERLLFKRADLVFTGGQSLYEAKLGMHPRVFAFPSSVDAAHFERARRDQRDPDDQAAIPHPRIGYFGVVDERLDVPLLACTAQALRDVHFIMIGPVVKIDPGILPTGSNIHWLGPKAYAELPAYMGKWDAGWMPFALNQATRFISPTKTPEFLAAGLPVVSTAIVDVVRTYAARGFVQIADADSMEFALRNALDRSNWNLGEVDGFLRNSSWDSTWLAMRSLMHSVPGRHARAADKVDTYV
jgi:glycosyltransferase involved in cell wall biosynthesis